MSRYMIDKLLVAVDRTDEALVAFVDDAGAFIDDWEARGRRPSPPQPEGGTLTPEERAAFEAWDYARLYRMGAHPYLLWHWVRAIYVPGRMSLEALVGEYRERVEPLGYPDFTT